VRAAALDVDIAAELAKVQARRVKYRSPGLHLSDCLKFIMTVLDPGKYGDSGAIDPLMVAQGFLWEDLLSGQLGRQLGMRQTEVERDGIFITLDGFNTDLWRTREAKATKISAANPIASAKFWYWHAQMMAGCRAMDTRECELVVLFINGSYELGGGRFGRQIGRAWVVGYSEREIEDNWRMVLRARDRIRRRS
jgi:hypothetical protein